MEDGELKSPTLHIVNKSSVYLTVREVCISNTSLTSFSVMKEYAHRSLCVPRGYYVG